MPATYPPSGFAVDAIMCDSAVTADGKLYIQGGGWNILSSPMFPFSQPRIGVAAVVSVPYTATNKNHKFELWLENQDSERQPIGLVTDASGAPEAKVSVEAQFNLGRPPILQAGDSQNLPIAINLDNVIFTSPGGYSFVLSINDQEMERLTFRILDMSGMGIAAGV